jgi:hypothetical protein
VNLGMLGVAQPETGLHHKAGISKRRKFICRHWFLMGIVIIWAEFTMGSPKFNWKVKVVCRDDM